jgi:homoserine dehydrogenase
VTRPTLQLLLVGFGHVARRFVRLLAEQGERLPFTATVVGIVTRRHGLCVADRGLDAVAAADLVERGGLLSPPEASSPEALVNVVFDLREAAVGGRVVMVETTLLDVRDGQPARRHVDAGLHAGLHVVSANKGPAAFAWRALQHTARRANRSFLCEGAVMDGIPVLGLVRDTMPGVRVEGFRGIVNTTCGFVLSAMEQGQPYAAALAEMQARGIAEADPSLDVDGWDAAAKVAVLANAWFDAGVTPHDVARTGIAGIEPRDVLAAAARGAHLRLVASGRRLSAGVALRVAPEVLEPGDPLATLRGVENALYVTTDLLGEVGIVQRTGTLTQTAYALVADLARVAAVGAGHLQP